CTQRFERQPDACQRGEARQQRQAECQRHSESRERLQRVSGPGQRTAYLHGDPSALVEVRDHTPTRDGASATPLVEPERVEWPGRVEYAALPQQLAVEEHLCRADTRLVGQVGLD